MKYIAIYVALHSIVSLRRYWVALCGKMIPRCCSISDPGLFLRFCKTEPLIAQDPAWQVQQDRGRLARLQRRT